jgi:hypothetical protein
MPGEQDVEGLRRALYILGWDKSQGNLGEEIEDFRFEN